MLLGGEAGERLEDVGVVGRAALQRPFLHRLGDRVGERGVERLAVLERRLELLEASLGRRSFWTAGEKTLAPNGLFFVLGQIDRAERLAVGAPLRRGHVLLPDPGHLGLSPPTRGRAPRAAGPA